MNIEVWCQEEFLIDTSITVVSKSVVVEVMDLVEVAQDSDSETSKGIGIKVQGVTVSR